ncbi:hypothetical protein P5G50_00325 [Leifsonia sp. F6_8S_P_1B]|uniref:Uncharacterized protein n=1 Tax=Leifsonia williamsii TaxID=3035919 RepID=A0ABT8K600_9MICO|nr:hypothetical protein [Leifsonia williamsii]MDN4612879.1 hypothetical protein [Leifsonia williamsii]
MKQRTLIVAGLAAAAVIAAGAFTLTQLPTPAATDASRSGSASPTARPHAATPAPTAPSTSAPSTSGPAPSSTAGPGSGAGAGPDTPSAGKRYSTEVLPPVEKTSPALPPSDPLPVPVSAPLPRTASATGGLVSGYPEKVLPITPGARVKTSSVASQGSRLQVTMTATTPSGVTDILAFYRTALAKYGMYDTPAPAQGGATALRFDRDGSSVTVTAAPTEDGSTYVIFGTFTAKG